MDKQLETQIEYLDTCIKSYRDINSMDALSLVEILPKITAILYFLEDKRSFYHNKYQEVINRLVLEKQSVNRAENQAAIEVPEIYFLRHKMAAAYECVSVGRSKISWIKQEKQSV